MNGTAARDASKNDRATLKSGEYRQVFVAEIPDERAVEHLAVRRRQRWRESREVKDNVVPIAQAYRSQCQGRSPGGYKMEKSKR